MHGPLIKKPRLLAVCHLPPPVHGAALMGQAVTGSQRLHEAFDVTVLPVRINKGFNSLQRFSIAKVWASLKLCLAVGRALIVEKPAAVYLTAGIGGMAFWRDLVLVLLCRAAGTRRIFHLHMKGVRQRYEASGVMRIAYRAMFHNAEVLHLSSRLYKDVACVVPKHAFHVVANGIAVPGTADEPARDTGPPTVLFLSNLYASKGPLDLLEASRRLAAKGVAHKLVFAGAGTEPDVVRRIEAATHDVRWAGPVYGETKNALLRSADVFAFPSYYAFECQPLAVIEAMAHGCAIIASDEAGIPDLIEHGRDGLLVRAHDIDTLTLALERLILDAELRRKLGLSARARYTSEFTLEMFERRMTDTLVSLCAPASAPVAACEQRA